MKATGNTAWEKYIKKLGFKYNKTEGRYIKPGNFGSKVTVETFMKRLFHITKNGDVVFSDFVWTFEEFKERINNAIK